MTKRLKQLLYILKKSLKKGYWGDVQIIVREIRREEKAQGCRVCMVFDASD